MIDDLDDVFPPRKPDPIDPFEEWLGMPEYEHEDKTSYRRIVVHFKDQAAVDQFERAIGQSFGKKLKSIWFPDIEIERCSDKAYVVDA